MPTLPNRLGRAGTEVARPSTGGFVMRITPNRLTSSLYHDPVAAKRDRYHIALDSTKKAHGQTDKGITVANLLDLIVAVLTDLCSGATTLTGLRITQQFRTQSFQSVASLGLRSEQIHRTVKGCSRDLVTGRVVQLLHSSSTLGQHEESHLLRRDANLANGIDILRHSVPHKRSGLLSHRDRDR